MNDKTKRNLFFISLLYMTIILLILGSYSQIQDYNFNHGVIDETDYNSMKKVYSSIISVIYFFLLLLILKKDKE